MRGDTPTAVACGLAVLVVVQTARTAYEDHPERREETLRATTWAVVLCMWPLLWRVVATCEGCDRCSSLILLWPYVIMASDLLVGGQAARVHIEPGTLTSVTFAVAGMLGALRDPVRSRFFIAAIMINLLFVFPTPVALPASESKVVVESAQRALTTVSAALVASGVLYRKPVFDPRASW